jgi:hypothetical protein
MNCPKCGNSSCSDITTNAETAIQVAGVLGAAACIVGAIFTGGLTLGFMGAFGSWVGGDALAKEIHQSSGSPAHRCNHCSHTWN